LSAGAHNKTQAHTMMLCTTVKLLYNVAWKAAPWSNTSLQDVYSSVAQPLQWNVWNDVMATVLKVWWQIKNLTLSINEEQSCQTEPDLKRWSLRLFLKRSSQQDQVEEEEQQQDE